MIERTMNKPHGANGGRPPLAEIPLTENARTVLEKRYLRRGEDGKPVETIPEMFWRVASHVAAPDAEYGHDAYATSEQFYELLTSLRFFPNSPTFTGAGTPLGQLAACFTADMRVTTDQGVKRIADLQVGDRVLTHMGRYRPVTELHQRAYNGELLRIKVKLIGTTIEVTPEHPIMTPAGWVRAGQLVVGDKVAIGMPQGVRSTPHFDLAESVYADELEMQVADASIRVRRPRRLQDPASRVHRSGVVEATIGLDEPHYRFTVIESIEAENYTGTVYNCEVDEDHSYVTEGVVVHNCFVLPISDDLGRASDGIFQTLRDAALIQQTGGGNGFAFSRLRPKGDIVKASAGRATGPVGFLRVYDKAFGEVAQGGCLTPDTLVFTEKGLLRLDELADPRQPGWKEHDLSLPTDDGPRHSPRSYNNGVVPILRVHTREGLTLAGTPNHKVKVMTAEGPAWRQLDELQTGDSILVMLGQHTGRWQALKRVERSHSNQVEPTLPPVLDEELAFFLGYLTGGGFVAQPNHDHRVGVTVAPTSYLTEEMPKLMQRIFGVKVHKIQKPDDASITFVMDNRAVKEFLQINGLAKSQSTNASVPRLIRMSPAPVVGAYLRGLFEADGSLSHGYPTLSTASERLAHEVATLLIGLGAPVKVYRAPTRTDRLGKTSPFIVRITSHVGLAAWAERIGCDRRSRFSVCYIWRPDMARESSYELPHPDYWLAPVLETVTLPQGDAGSRGMGRNLRSVAPRLRRSLLRYLRGERSLTLSAYRSLAERHPQLAERARRAEGMWFVSVSQVEPAGESLTLDLEVDGNHTYLANGMVTHNTRRGANMAVLRVDHPDIEEFITCKEDENQITNFNISVALTDAFMRAVENDEPFDLVNPRDGKVWRTVRARDLFDKIIKYAHHNGEPGALFIDIANRSNPVPHLYELEATNPCVTGDTLVATPSGWRRADQIREGDAICTVLGTGQVAAVEINESVPVFDVYLSDGAVVRATASHQFHARDSRTKFFETRRLDELKPGDWVRVYRSVVPDNPVPATSADLTDREYGFLVGVLVGDGCYTPHALSKNVVRLSTHADEVEWNDLLQRAFAKVGVEKIYTYVNEGSRSMMMDPKPGRVIADWVKSLPLEPRRGPEKRLPDVYINSNREFLTGLLDGLFSTDGSVDLQSNHPLLRFHTSSLELARQVRRILLMFGVYARISISERKRHDINGRVIRHDRPKYDVTISGDSLGRFFEQIPLSHPGKRMRLEEAALKANFTGGNWAAKVVKIEPAGVATVYDLYEPRSDTWITEGFVSRGCGEQWLGPYENCCLGSINLAKHVTPEGKVDWEKLRESTVISTHFLDNVVSANKYVPAVPQLKEAALRARRIGLGIMGLGDLMYHMGIRYGSDEAQEFAAQVMEFVRFHCMKTSIELAQERGPFPAIKGSIYDPEDLKWTPPQPLKPYTRDFGRPPLDWDEIVRGIKQHGIRNAAQTTIAPTGTIATVAGCEAYGCEPVFALAYIRHVNDHGRDLELTYTSPLFEQALIKAGLDEAARKRIVDEVILKGTCQHIEEVPPHIRHTFVVSQDITAEEHVWMQAALQAFVDNSLSKTINFPATATDKDVADAYFLAWRLGCKGLTVYVTGSREKVVLETRETKEKKAAAAQPAPPPAPAQAEQPAQPLPVIMRPRPRWLPGRTYRVPTPLGTGFITINENGGGQPFEVFMNVGKAGSDTAAVAEALGRLISLVLRLPSPMAPLIRLRQVIDQLSGIGGGRPMGFGPQRVRSLPDGVAQALADYLGDKEGESQVAPVAVQEAPQPVQLAFKIGDLCPECGEASLVNEEGCRKCYTCGFTEC